MKKLFLLAILLCAAPARAQCPLTEPEVLSFSADHYYTALQWSALPSVTVIGPAPFAEPIDGDPSNALWYVSIHKNGSQNTVLLEPALSGAKVTWLFSQKQNSNGCWEASYQGQGIADAPFKPAFCVYGNPRLPASCSSRVNSSFTAEIPAWQVVDTAGHSSELAKGKCIDQGPPFNAGDRGALCMGPNE